PNIIENWCSIDPAGCAEEMRRCESQSATNPPQSTTPPSAPSFECAACIISNRPDILPFYQSNGWNIDQSNWVNIILDWYRIAPEGFLGEAQRCGSVCGYAHTITADANLALQAVSCAADSAYDSNYDGNKARDANAATKWCSTASTSGHWLKYNLGGIKEVHKIVVRHAGSNGEMQAMNTQTFQLRFGRNDNNWEVSFDVNNSNQSHVTEYNVGSINAQYVMLYITDCGIDNYARIYEFEVWGTDTTVQTVSNLALSASSCTADTAYDSNYGGHKAKDGNTATKWCSTNGSASHWLKYDLGGLKEINRLVVRHAGSNGEMQVMNTEAFELRFGRSDNNWETTCTVSNTGRENITDFNVGSVIARYVMLYITDCGIDNYARIYEFEVWGTAASSNSTPSPTLSSTATPVSTAVSTPDPTATPAPTTVLPPAPASLKGAYWLQYDGGYESYPANVPPVAWNLDYCGMVPDNAAGYRTYYLPRNIKTLARLTLDLTPDEKQSLENLSNPAPQLAQRLAHWNSQVDQVCGALGGDFDNLIYGFIFGNEENLGGESNISGVAYARAYNAFRAQWNGRGKPLLASGPGGCGVGGQCTDFYNGMLSVIGSVDGFAIHAYGYESFKNYSDMGGFIDQINAINRAKGRPPVFITEYNIPLQMTQPQNALQWGKYFNDRYNDVLSFNASNGNQIKALLYFVDAQDHWSSRRYGSNREIVAQAWWDYSLKKGSVTGDGRREAWKNAPFAPQ
ncbi:MAG: discoidin domain-containing protein, partial [Spirochaetales bacterium]|nr:discoidin domain-containing protein [Spirochaetales bacterium]